MSSIPTQCKGSRTLRSSRNFRKSRSKKRKPINPKLMEGEPSSFSTSAKKMKVETDVPEDKTIEYRLINFMTVFSAVSSFVMCRECGEEVKFGTTSTRGLGFKISMTCDKCPTKFINSCPSIQNTYEVNRRFILAMRLLGIGFRGVQTFCGLMDMPSFLTQNTYDLIVKGMYDCVKVVAENMFEKAVKEEITKTENSTDLTVSGDGSWKKLGVDLYGVVAIIGHNTGKVLDLLTKNLFCEECESWSSKKETPEFERWMKRHDCEVNQTSKIQNEAMIEIFERSEKNHGVRYLNYIENDDSSYNQILKSKPYGDRTIIKNKSPEELNQNINFNQLIWKITPKILPSGSVIVEMAAYTSAILWNEGFPGLLKLFEALGVLCGPNMHVYLAKVDADFTDMDEDSPEAKILRRELQAKVLEAFIDTEGIS